jgi:gliding motility-associated-like protein
MRKITFLLFALLISFVGYSQFPTPGTEGFESTAGPDLPLATAVSPWTLGTGATGNQWAVFDNGVAGTPKKRWDRTTTNFYAGTQAAFINRKQIGSGNTSQDFLATPLITVPASGQLTFWTRLGFNVGDAVDYVIKVNTITTAGSQTTPANYTTTVQSWNQTNLVTTYNVYEQKTVDLSAYAGQQVYLAFVRVYTQPTGSLGGNSWYVDDVKIVQQCLAPNNLTATNITQNSADLNWSNPSGSTSWEIEVVPATGTPTGAGDIYNGALPYPAVGLTPATGYVYYVRSKCADSDSVWVGPFNFTTLTPGLYCASAIIIPPALPYSTTDTTANYSDTLDTAQPTACAGTATNYMTGNDVFYTYTADTTGAISITMTPQGATATNSSMFVYDGCANVGVACLAGVANATSNVRDIPSLNVIAGQTYIIVLSSTSATQTYPYNLVIQQLNCAAPSALAVSGTTYDGTNLSWTSPTATSWEYVVQTAGSGIPSGSGTTTTSSTVTPVSGLNPDTAYQYWVRADCGDGTFSAWTGPFLFTTAVAPPVCGGQFIDDGGQAGNYSNSANTIYPICPTTAGDQVTVTFTAFNTELNNDTLSVYDGNGTTGILLGTYSGTTIPGPITSSSPDGCLTFVFNSNGTTNASGWVANVTCAPAPACQKPILLTTPTVLYNSVQLAWTQPANPDTTVSTAWEILVLPCGSPVPTAATSGISVTTNPYTYSGLAPLTCYDFYIRSICSTNSEWVGATTATTPIAPPICGGNFVDTGLLTGNYANNANYSTPICPTNPGEQVTVTFTAFSTQLNNDILKVYDGNGTTGNLLGSFSGTTIPPAITSSTPDGCLTFVFTSNASTTSSGWLANVTCAPAPPCQKPILLNAPSTTVLYNSVQLAWIQPANPDTTTATAWEVLVLPCGSPAPTASATGVISASTNPFTVTGLTPLTCYDFYVRAVCSSTSSSSWTGPTTATTPIAPPICGGNFVDPGGLTGNYPNNVTAATGTTTISPVTPGDHVTVTFTAFNTQANTDLLQVYDGVGTAGLLLATYSGTTIPPAITSSSPDGSLTFVFTSNGSTNAAGWLADVTCAPAPPCQKPVVFSAPSSTVLYNSVQLAWTQPANPDTSLATAWEVIALPCGSPAPTASATGVISATTNPFTVTGLIPLTCYDFYVRAVCSSTSSSTWTGPVTASTPIAPPICGGNYVDPGGIAANYANNITAATGTTTICPTNPGDQVTVTFTAFSTELNNDILKVYSGTGTAGILLGTYSGTAIPQPVTSASPDGCLTFVFTSNGSINSTGWVSSVTCAPAPACQKPVAINTPSVQSTAVTLSWTQAANPDTSVATAWEIVALPCGSPAPSASTTGIISATSNPYTVTGLTLSTCYDFYIRAICSSTSSSSWSGPKTATTTPCDNACNYTFTVSDSFGDGWNGNTMSVIQNGVTVATLTGPTTAQGTVPQQVPVTLCPGVFQLFWNAGGNFGTEVAVTITSFLGEVIYTHASGTSLQNTLLFSDNTICTPPTCPKPTAVSAGSTSDTTATVSWTENGTATQWEIIYLPQGSPAPLPGATGTIVTTNPATLTGLSVGTFYDVYVRAVCSPTDSSFWTNVTPLYINPPLPNCAGVNLNLTTTSPGVLDVCPDNNCVSLTATYTDSHDTSSYNVYSTAYAPPFPFTGGTQVSVNIDDVWSGDLPIPFKFCFYGTAYNFLNIGSNGVVTFNTHAPNSNCPWAYTAQIPSTTFPILNAIYAPYQDTNPSITTPPAQPNINYQVLGIAPCRVFVINFTNEAQFSCANSVGLQTSQLVLYETSNVIDIYVKDRTACTTWNSGSGVIGIQNAAGTNAVVPPNRNTGPWEAHNEAWRFLPAGNSNVTFQWLQDGAPLTTNLSTTVCLTQDTNLTAQATYTACDGTQVIKSENILLNLLTPVTPTFAPIGPLCQGVPAPVLPSTSNNTTGSITGVWSPATIDTSVSGTVHYTFTPTAGQCAVPSSMDVTINNSITPSFNTPAPICAGTPAPVLPTSSNDLPTPITGSWTPAVVSNTASATYTFNPDPGQCAASTTVQVTVNNSCALGSYASAVWLTNCATSNFFNTVGSGPDLIGPATNVFTNTDFGTYVQNSNNFILRGAELKTFKSSSSNFCSARLNYRVYPAATTPGTFQVMDLPWLEDCTGSTFPTGGPCNPGDQKWHRVVANGTTTPYAPVNLTAFPPGNYVLQVYYDLTGSDSSASGCNQNFLVDNNGAYYTATFTIQAQPSYASTSPTTCGGANGSIAISGMEPSTTYGVSYQFGTTPVGPLNLVSDASGQITIGGLTAGTYSNFSITLNNCVYPYTTPIVLVDPSVPTVTVNSPTVCSGTLATVTATPGSAATYSYAWTCPSGFTNPGDVATFTTSVAGIYSVVITNTLTGCSSTSASGIVIINPIITPTFNAIAPLCSGTVAPILPTVSTNTPTSVSGTWSPSVVSNTTSGTYIFTPNAGQCSQPITINVTVNSVPVPVVSVLTQPTCAVPTGSVEVTSPLSVTGGTTPTDLFISEATDSNSGSLSYVELYNGTGASINLANYSIKTANNGNAYGFTLPLNNVNVASGATYVVALGNNSANACPDLGADGSLGAQTNVSGSVNFSANGNDHYGLFNGSTLIDSWGEFGNNNWAPSSVGTEGADFRRKNNVTPLPNPTYNNNDWDVLDYAGNTPADCANNDYSNIGVYAMTSSTTSYQYNVDGGAYQTSPVFTGLTPGVHTITVQDMLTGCISVITTVTINTPPVGPTVTVNSPSVCGINATVTATPGTPGTYSYVWTVPSGAVNPGNVDTFVATVSGSYCVVITNTATGCSSSSVCGTVTLKPIPTVTVSNPVNCGVSATIAATPGTAGIYTYAWTVPAGSSNPGNVASFNATVSGTYSVVITNTTTGCASASASGVATINALPTVSVNSSVVCNGTSSTVTATPGTAGTYSYAWTVPAGAANPGNVASFTSTVAGTYSVIITNTSTGCISISASGTIAFVPSFDYTLFGECVDNNFTLEIIPSGNSFDPSTSTFNWTVNSNTLSIGTNSTFNSTAFFTDPAVTTPMPATFNVNVTTVDGCQQSHSILVDRIYCEIQKGISPNNDTKNDFFDLRLMNVQQLEIFNRYGTKVYAKADYTNEWIGQSNSGSELPDGTYYYVIEFKNNQPTKTGWIYINRDSK